MNIKEKLDIFDEMCRNGDLGAAELMLKDWIGEAQSEQDTAALLTLYNEQAGLFRVTGRAEEAGMVSMKALSIVRQLGLTGTVHHGTTLLNAATNFRAAGDREKAAQMYSEAADVYYSLDGVDPYYVASLYNNLSQLQFDSGRVEDAIASLNKAKDIIDSAYPGSPEAATTRVNAAYYLMAADRLDDAEKELDEAFEYFGTEDGNSDGHRGSALSAKGQLMLLKGDSKAGLELLEQAKEFVFDRFGDSDEYKAICSNIAKLTAAGV
ncbi:MAG: tetratricopeptide repeat protein [Firmicutes bacterium]|nr:tetratricopeptide repeat protein [Bacillota bacterium]